MRPLFPPACWNIICFICMGKVPLMSVFILLDLISFISDLSLIFNSVVALSLNQ
jgi:hypothetical protein